MSTQEFLYQKTGRYFAQAAPGLEDIAALELEQIGACDVQSAYRGIYFNATPATLYLANYLSRLTTRILAPLISFDCHSTKYLYATAAKFPWRTILDPDTTFAIQATTVNSRITHSRYAALCLKDAIADYFRDKTGRRPSVNALSPDVRINLHVQNNKAVISLDTSGDSLHKRGYRLQPVEAPMQETLAAAIIHLSGWNGRSPLVDPMCGSGTLLAEALMRHCQIPAGFLRKRFGFEKLPDFDNNLWKKLRKEADGKILPLAANLIAGSDIDRTAINAAARNLATLPGGDKIILQKKHFNQLGRIEKALIVCNPPYGIRMGKGEDMGILMKGFGDFLKRSCTGSTALVYFGNKELLYRGSAGSRS